MLPSRANGWRTNLAGAGMGGMFDPKNLNGFGYVHQNPMRFTDPDGRCPDGCVAEGYGVYILGTLALVTVSAAWEKYGQPEWEKLTKSWTSGPVMSENAQEQGKGEKEKGKPAPGVPESAANPPAEPKPGESVTPPPAPQANQKPEKRVSSKTLRGRWQRFTGNPWPKDPKDPKRNQDVSHKQPLADKGANLLLAGDGLDVAAAVVVEGECLAVGIGEGLDAVPGVVGEQRGEHRLRAAKRRLGGGADFFNHLAERAVSGCSVPPWAVISASRPAVLPAVLPAA